MHPGLMYWWKSRRDHHHDNGGEAGEVSCGPGWGGGGERHGWGRGWHGGGGGWRQEAGHEHGDPGGGSFGVRRPLRFLAYKLELDEKQVAELAKILSDLKTERAQGDVDGRRTVSGFADAIGAATFDEAGAKAAAELRVKSAERLRDAVVKALSRMHAVLDEEQRGHLSYLIRTGVISI
jgi:Spy/CpxP family protein refolding chaperone